MQFNQVIPPSAGGGEGQYDFIMNGPPKPAKSLLPSGGSRKQRIIVVVGGAIAVFSIFAIILMLIFTSGGEDKKALTNLVLTQTELIRVSDGAVNKSRDVGTQSFAQTTTLVITSSRKQTTDYLAKQRVKVSDKQISLSKNAKTDEALNSAEKAGRYDAEAIAVIEKSLASYKTELKAAFGKATTANQKKLIQQLYDEADKLTKNQPTNS